MMKNARCPVCVFVFATVVSLLCGVSAPAFAAAPITDVPSGETFFVGGDGADPRNVKGGFIILNEGSTLVVTQTVALTLWSTLIATNGAATLEFRTRTSDLNTASCQGHMFVRGAGSLTVKGVNCINAGHPSDILVYDIENLVMEEQDGAGIVFGSSSTILSFPASTEWTVGESGSVWLCGSSDMFPDEDEVVIAKGRYVLANTSAVPASKTILVSGAGSVLVHSRTVPDTSDIVSSCPRNVTFGRSDGVYTNGNSFVFERNQHVAPVLELGDDFDCVFTGDFSGSGIVEVTGVRPVSSAAYPLTVTLSGDNSGFSGTISLRSPGMKLVLGSENASGSAVIEPVVSDATVVGMPGAEPVIDTGRDGCEITLAGAGEFSLDNPQRRFEGSVTYWFDFSHVDSYSYPGEGTATPYPDAAYEGFQLVERVVDWRYPDAHDSLWNRRLYMENDQNLYDYVYGCRRNDAGAGGDMCYLSFAPGRSRRIPFSPPAGYNQKSPTPVQLAVMVFGSQFGGGKGLIGTTSGAFGRTGETVAHGITTNTMHKIWVDGVEVDPTAANVLNGGWQVISISMDGKSFDGLGWNSYSRDSNYGGQNYGELLLFTGDVTEVQRLDAEIYLAEKWGLSGNYSSAARDRHKKLSVATNRISVLDGVTVRAGGDTVEMSGVCSGTVSLDGGALISGKRVMDESEIPSAGRLFWLDADDRSLVSTKEDIGTTTALKNEVRAVRNKGSSGYEVGDVFAYGTGTRAPTWIRMSRNGGPLRGWIDFNQYYSYIEGVETDGNDLRFFTYSSDFSFWNGKPANMAEMPARTVFVVHDSFNRYSSPLLDSVSGSSVKPRTSFSSPIWPDGTAAGFVNGENRLNGRVVDQKDGFIQDTQVFTVRATEQVNVPFIEYYKNSEKFSYEEGKAGAIGEMLYYSGELTDEEVSGIESYLMLKWMNRLPPGFADLSGVTVSGTGTVEVADAGMCPAFGSGFDGQVAVGGTREFNVVVDPPTGEVSGALVAPGATLDLPSACTVKVDFTSVPELPGERVEYVLIDCAGLTSPVEWTFVKGENVSGRWTFVQSDGKVSLVFKPVGCRLIVR